MTFLDELADTAWGVTVAVVPLVVLFLAFQALLLRLPRQEVARVLTGTLLAALGLFLFLLGLGLAFLPYGRLVGQALSNLSNDGLVVAIGALLGFLTAWGEPSVRVLAKEVEKASGGALRIAWVVAAVSLGSALAVGVGLVRIMQDVPIGYLLGPGYALAFLLFWASDRSIVAIAADAGGVATGPLANTFLLAMALGASSAVGSDQLTRGFGLVALIALAPLLSVMGLGVVLRIKARPRSVP